MDTHQTNQPAKPPSAMSIWAQYQIEMGDWEQLQAAARAVRYAVFVEEQNIPVELEWDDLDEVSVHVVIFDSQLNPVATGRLLPDAHIGRLAVLAEHRQSGLGAKVLNLLIEKGRELGYPELVLHAQTSAQGFYQRYGFEAFGQTFIEAGIEHQAMRLVLAEHHIEPVNHFINER